MQLKEGLLRQIFGFGPIAHHPHTQGIDALFMQSVKLGKGKLVSRFGLGKQLSLA
jgi:hypothetical protein